MAANRPLADPQQAPKMVAALIAPSQDSKLMLRASMTTASTQYTPETAQWIRVRSRSAKEHDLVKVISSSEVSEHWIALAIVRRTQLRCRQMTRRRDLIYQGKRYPSTGEIVRLTSSAQDSSEFVQHHLHVVDGVDFDILLTTRDASGY